MSPELARQMVTGWLHNAQAVLRDRNADVVGIDKRYVEALAVLLQPIPLDVQEAHHDLDSDPLERFDTDMAVHAAFVP